MRPARSGSKRFLHLWPRRRDAPASDLERSRSGADRRTACRQGKIPMVARTDSRGRGRALLLIGRHSQRDRPGKLQGHRRERRRSSAIDRRQCERLCLFRVPLYGASMVGTGSQPALVDRRGLCPGHRTVRARRGQPESHRRGSPVERRTPGRKRLPEARGARTSGFRTDRRPERGRAARHRSDSAGGPTQSTVLLLGETGTGKELFATQIHELGPRRNRSMVRVNCAAIPPTLMESELFGRERGAFTGALARQIGRFEMADHSTIFLDEIGDLPLDVQVKLLRVLEEKTIERLGSPQPIRVDVRIIAATHRNLEKRVADGAFREDLYYRLNVFPVAVPPLRDRPDDIPLLVWRFVEEFSKAFGRRIDSIDRTTFMALSQYAWPGNIRELRNVVERAMIVATGHRLSIPLPHAPHAPPRRSPKLADVEKEHIRAVLEATAWRIRGTGGAADRLGLKPTTLETRMAKLGLKRPGAREAS